jgi:hypothetical protein
VEIYWGLRGRYWGVRGYSRIHTWRKKFCGSGGFRGRNIGVWDGLGGERLGFGRDTWRASREKYGSFWEGLDGEILGFGRVKRQTYCGLGGFQGGGGGGGGGVGGVLREKCFNKYYF